MGAPSHSPTPLDTLSSEQVRTLLRSLDLHRSLLDAAHDDALRSARTRASLAYVVDYQLIWRYIHSNDLEQAEIAELHYLFSNENISFVIGFGSRLEIIRAIKSNFNIDATSPEYKRAVSLRNYFELLESRSDPKVRSRLYRALVAGRGEVAAVRRLGRLLERPNFKAVEDVPDLDNYFDAKVLDSLTRHLDQLRPRMTNNNFADAINLAHVIALRKSIFDHKFFCLLTDTSALLDDDIAGSTWPDYTGYSPSDLCRTPLGAIYSHVALSVHRNPRSAVRQTANLVLAAENFRHALRMSRGHLVELKAAPFQAWQAIASKRTFTASAIDELQNIAQFINSPLINETQRIYDNVRLTSSNIRSQSGTEVEVNSPRQIFDLLLGLTKSLDPKNDAKDFSSLWQDALSWREMRRGSYNLFQFVESRDTEAWTVPTIRHPYLNIERHKDRVVCRWPTRTTFNPLVDFLGSAMTRHEVGPFHVEVGLEHEVVNFDAELPVGPHDLSQAVDRQPIFWIRYNSEDLDIYADLITEPGTDPVVGVITSNPNAEHFAWLYEKTSSRFVFKAWLTEVFSYAFDVKRLYMEEDSLVTEI